MKAQKELVRMGRNIGAALGGIVFLIFGIIPGIFFGSYGTLLIIRHLVGGPVEPTVLVRMVVAIGMVLGVVCIASVSIVVGSIVGTLFGYLAEAITSPAKGKEAETAVMAK